MKNKDILFDENLLIEIFVKADGIFKIIEKELVSKMIEDKNDDYTYKKTKCEFVKSTP